jgi:phosphate:Na+ symporter
LIWQLESNAAERYFQRLRGTQAQNGGSDDFYLRIIRDLKRIHSLIAALGYPILDRAGQLQDRLVEVSNGAPQVPEEEAASTDALTRRLP